MKYTDKHSLKFYDKNDEDRVSARKSRRRIKKYVDSLFKEIDNIDPYWSKTMDNEEKTRLYHRYKSSIVDYKSMSYFITNCKENGYGDIGKARELKINDVLKSA